MFSRYFVRSNFRKSDIFAIIAVNIVIAYYVWSPQYKLIGNANQQKPIESPPAPKND